MTDSQYTLLRAINSLVAAEKRTDKLMRKTTGISWTDKTASPWHGCAHAVYTDADGKEHAHSGCSFCYAEKMSKRNPGTLGVWGKDGTRVISASFHDNCRRWNRQAEKAGKRASVFPSICDPFESHELVEWKEFAPGYRISIYGVVETQWRAGGGGQRTAEWRALDPSPGKGGYLRVNLGFDGASQTKRIHCLVLEAFVGPCPEGQQVRHLDGNPANNCLWNLHYGTSKENHADRRRHGTDAAGERNGRAKITREQADEIRKLCAAGKSQSAVGQQFGIGQATVSKIVLGHYWAERPTELEPVIVRHAAPGQILHHNGQPAFRDDGKPLTMSDLRRDLFATIDACPWLTFLLLTKRPQNVRGMWHSPGWSSRPGRPQFDIDCKGPWQSRNNVYLLTSISTQADADAMIPHLLECRDLVPILGVSAEPLLSDINLLNAACGYDRHGYRKPLLTNAWLDWLIIGNESRGKGVGRLPGGTEAGFWDAAKSLVEQCRAAGVKVWFKQGPIDGRTSHDPATWPAWARVQERPEGSVIQ